MPFPTTQGIFNNTLPGLSAGPVIVEVLNQTSSSTWALVGSTSLTVNDTRTPPRVNSITPNPIDLATPPSSFTLSGSGFANLGFGLPAANFSRNGTLIGQVRATSTTGGTTLVVPFPTTQGIFNNTLPGLSAGPVIVEVLNQTSSSTWALVGSTSLTVNDTRTPPRVNSITPNPIDLATPPSSFTLSGSGFANLGFGLPAANFSRNGTLIGQVRATSTTGGTTLVVPFPTTQGIFNNILPGLSAGPVIVEVLNQTSSSTWALVGSTSLTVNDTRTPPRVNSITPNPIDLATPPSSFTLSGSGFANLGFGLPAANFSRNGTLIGQVRATSTTGGTTLVVPFPTTQGIFNNILPGLSAGPVIVEVLNQTSSSTWALVGSTSLTVNDTRTPPRVNSITPNPIDLATPPSSFTLSGSGFANLGFGLPAANFSRNGTLIGQVRATSTTGGTTLVVPFPTTQGIFNNILPGLSAGPVIVEVLNQTSSSTWALVGSTSLTVNDTRTPPRVNSITPNPIDLATPPSSFTLSGSGFANLGFGLPAANFSRNGTLIGQVRATSTTGGTTLVVPFPTTQGIFNNTLPGLSAGPVIVEVLNQTSSSTWALVGSTSLTVNDTRVQTSSR